MSIIKSIISRINRTKDAYHYIVQSITDGKNAKVVTQVFSFNDKQPLLEGQEVNIYQTVVGSLPGPQTIEAAQKSKLANKTDQHLRMENLKNVLEARLQTDNIQTLRENYPDLIFTNNNTVVNKSTGAETDFREWYLDSTLYNFHQTCSLILIEGHENEDNFSVGDKTYDYTEKANTSINDLIIDFRDNYPETVPPVSNEYFDKQIQDIKNEVLSGYLDSIFNNELNALTSMPSVSTSVEAEEGREQ